jgi:hypothetical protein
MRGTKDSRVVVVHKFGYIFFLDFFQVLKKAIPSRFIVISILLITLGCLVASAGDLVNKISIFFNPLKNLGKSFFSFCLLPII